MRDVLAVPIIDGGNLGMGRRQLHKLLRNEDYDGLAAAEIRIPGSAPR
jgi:acyl-CoA dehydrogenase